MSRKSRKKFSERWLLMDYGEVISNPMPSDSISVLALVAALNEKVFVERYWRFRRTYDLGESPLNYWSDVVGRDLTGNPTLVQELDSLDTSGWSSVNNETMAILSDVYQSANLRIGLLSNAPESVAKEIESFTWANYLEQTFFSCRLGLAKPDVRVFQRVLQELGVPASSVLFVDDRPENVAAAFSQGINTHHFTTAENFDYHLRCWL